jgi:hypothetical protein
MRKLMTLSVLALLVALGATAAQAQIDVELAFDPDVAAPGDMVTLFASIANLGDEAVVADLEVTVEAGDVVVGPLFGQVPLAAGEELSAELVFIVPPVPEGGTLTITVTATAGEYTDTAVATLTVVVGGGQAASARDLRYIGEGLVNQLGESAPTDQGITLGGLKHLYQ